MDKKGSCSRMPSRSVVLNLKDCCIYFLQENTAAWVQAWNRRELHLARDEVLPGKYN